MTIKVLQQRLDTIAAKNLKRSLNPIHGIDFSSNDYLGFAVDPMLRNIFLQRINQLPQIGASGSRLLRGNLEIYEETEDLLANFVKRECALFFPSGYQA